MCRILLVACALLAASLATWADGPARADNALAFSAGQKEFLTPEPILVTLKLGDGQLGGLPVAADGKSALRFEIKPAVKARKGAKPLPFEAQTKESKNRLYDLLEWYQFPAEGSFTVHAVLETKGQRVISPDVKITIRKPDTKDPEWGPVDRLHHIPWSNYITDAFCGDTFDVVKRWPDSKLAKYCHYWNGLHHQHKGEYEKAMVSFSIVTHSYPDFALAEDAQWQTLVCAVNLLERRSDRSGPEDLNKERRRQLEDLLHDKQFPPAQPRPGSSPDDVRREQALEAAIAKLARQQAGPAIKNVLGAQAGAWNKGDLPGFMAGYWKSDDLTFISGDKKTRGWQATLDRYRKKYQGEGKEMGKLSFKDIDIRMIADDHALVTGRWQLEMKEKTVGGLFTLIFHHTKEGWRIIHDHTS